MPVGEHSICSRKEERADMESAPTGLIGALIFIGRGWRLNVCEANFTLSEAKQHDRPVYIKTNLAPSEQAALRGAKIPLRARI